jgi:arylsulfatase A-like enzyme
LDVLPTLTALAGIERTSDRAVDGTSFVETFTGKPIRRDDALVLALL